MTYELSPYEIQAEILGIYDSWEGCESARYKSYWYALVREAMVDHKKEDIDQNYIIETIRMYKQTFNINQL